MTIASVISVKNFKKTTRKNNSIKMTQKMSYAGHVASEKEKWTKEVEAWTPLRRREKEKRQTYNPTA
jgi:hypothetical protein